MKTRMLNVGFTLLLVLLGCMLLGCSKDTANSSDSSTSIKRTGELASTKQFNVTLIDAFSMGDLDLGGGTYGTQEGCEYCFAVFEIENISSSDIKVSVEDFSFYADNTRADDTFVPRNHWNGYAPLLDGTIGYDPVTIHAGRKAKGYVVANVPVGTKVIEVIFADITFSAELESVEVK